MKTSKEGYLYLLLNPKAPPEVFKIGRTNNVNRRLTEYPPGSKYIDVFGPVEDCHQAEKYLIQAMKTKFRKSKFGTEYFLGDKPDILDCFQTFCYNDLQLNHMPWMPIPMNLDSLECKL